MVCKIGFALNDYVTGLKLLEKGFQKEDLAITVLLDFPLQLFIGYKAAHSKNRKKPLFNVKYLKKKSKDSILMPQKQNSG